MANLTITVPEDLKAQMDAQAEVNWSEVCRSAISVYLENKRNVVPRLSVRVDRTTFRYNSWTSQPALTAGINIRNLMGREVVLDRILYVVNLSSVKNGNPLARYEGSYLNKHVLSQDSEINLNLEWSFDYLVLEALSKAVKGSINSQLSYTVFLEGIKQPLNGNGSGVVPIDEWKDGLEQLQKARAVTSL